jgi:hypothetical protein
MSGPQGLTFGSNMASRDGPLDGPSRYGIFRRNQPQRTQRAAEKNEKELNINFSLRPTAVDHSPFDFISYLCLSVSSVEDSGFLFIRPRLSMTQIGKIQEESTAENAEGRREKREESQSQFFSVTLCVLCG